MNTALVVGILAENPIVKNITDKNNCFCKFILIDSPDIKGGTTYINCIATGFYAKYIGVHGKQGKMFEVKGRLASHVYEDGTITNILFVQEAMIFDKPEIYKGDVSDFIKGKTLNPNPDEVMRKIRKKDRDIKEMIKQEEKKAKK